MGLTQRRDSVPTIREIVNVQLLRGMIGKPGAGLCPVRGHSNVQGDRTMGIVEHPPTWPADAGRAARIRRRRPRPGTTPSTRSGPCATAGPRVFLGAGRQLRRRHPGHRGHRGGAALVRADRADLHQAQPLARGHRRGRADPALPRPHRARPAGRRRAVRHRRGLDVGGTRVARSARARLARTCCPRSTIVCRLAGATLGDTTLPWATFEADYRDDPRA